MSTVHPAVERADGLIELKRYEEAEALLGQRLVEDPDDVRAWTKLALCHVRAEQHEKALDATDRALALDPEDVGGLIMRSHALRGIGGTRWQESEGVLREAIRLAPDYWYGYALLADVVWRIRLVRIGQAGGGTITAEQMEGPLREAGDLAMEALRLGPEELHAYEVAWQIADLASNSTVADQLDHAILRLDPSHPYALARQTKKAASTPGVKAAQAATLYADALAAAPDSRPMQQGLDDASYRMLRGIRWIALFCLALIAASGLDLVVTEGETPRDLPVPLGQRLWFLVPMSALWAVGALLRYRRLRAGVRINIRSLIRRRKWPRIVLAQAAWAMLCTLLIAEIPWTERTVPQALFWAGLIPTIATIWFDRKKTTWP
ncbi:tetratricopeptide repeat protein [Streptomyces sp. NPDC093510]|uniref:tetratricopeptide repeat protein n=1 Tax=Streptomyces sp. NPDC093510 TaxID=3155199 RepID=UPI0034214952